jgi:hypothetical protein
MAGPNGSAEWIRMATQFFWSASSNLNQIPDVLLAGQKEENLTSLAKCKPVPLPKENCCDSWWIRKFRPQFCGSQATGDCTKNTPSCRHGYKACANTSIQHPSLKLHSWTHVHNKVQGAEVQTNSAGSWHSRKRVFRNCDLYIIKQSSDRKPRATSPARTGSCMPLWYHFSHTRGLWHAFHS